MQKNSIRIPSEETCRQFFCDMGMLEHIINHSRQVCRVATFLVDQLAIRSIFLNRDLVFSAAMLHDITKTRSFTTGEDHALTGAAFLYDLEYPEVARIVGQHVRLDTYSSTKSLSEAEIVNYADKRVLHDRVVSLKERMAYILEKYGRDPVIGELVEDLWGKTIALETRIFQHFSFSAEDLPGFINTAPGSPTVTG